MKWFVMGKDGQRYGPADLDELRDWLEEKRVKRDTIVEAEETGERSTVEAVLGLAPEIVVPDISLHTVGEGGAAEPVELVPLAWPEPEGASDLGDAGLETRTPKEVTFEFPGSSAPAPVEAVVVDAESVEWTPKKGPAKMSKAPRGNAPPVAGNVQPLVGISIVLTTIGFLAMCCIPVPAIAWALAEKARKGGAKGADGARAYAILMTVVTVGYWIWIAVSSAAGK